MKAISKQVYSILGLSALTLSLTVPSVKAETFPAENSEVTISNSELLLSETVNLPEMSAETAQLTLSEDEIALESVLNQESVTIPTPGSVATSTEAFFQEPANAQANPEAEATGEVDSTIAQRFPGRPRPRFSNSYIGVGLLTDLDYNEFVIQGKLGIGENYSVRPTLILDDLSSALILPITYDFNAFQNFSLGAFPVRPYAGGGILWVFEDIIGADQLGFAATGGVDVPISEQFTANANVNLFLIDGYASDFVFGFGIGYNFPNLFSR